MQIFMYNRRPSRPRVYAYEKVQRASCFCSASIDASIDHMELFRQIPNVLTLPSHRNVSYCKTGVLKGTTVLALTSPCRGCPATPAP